MAEAKLADLTFLIIGFTFEAFKELGYGYQERYYQRAFKRILEENRIPHQQEVPYPIEARGKVIGRYFVDFIIDGQVVVEWKVANEFYESHINQVLAYMRIAKIAVGLIARVTPKGVKIKRLSL